MYGDPQGDLKGLGGHCSGGGGLLPGGRGGYGRGVCRAAAAVRRSFWLLWEGERLLAFVDGFCTDWPDLTDEMYADASLHRENGAWQMIFGVNTIPACRRQGYAGQLLQQAIADARAQGRKGLVLTCKEALVHYYAKFGFVNEGVSASTHGGVVWYQMRLRF